MKMLPDNYKSRMDSEIEAYKNAHKVPGKILLMPLSVGMDGFLEDAKRSVSAGDRWGPWVYGSNKTLTHSKERYEIDLERISDAMGAIDLIDHMSHKAWITPEDMGHLIRAMQYCLDLNALSHGRRATGDRR